MNKKINVSALYAAFIMLLQVLLLTACPDPGADETDPLSGFFTVKFTNIGAATINNQTVKEGEFAEEPEAPLRDDYKFSGWYTINGEVFSFDTPITENLVLYAQWVRLFTVTFALNEDGAIFEQQIVETGSTAVDPGVPDLENYIFLGWYALIGSSYVPFSFNSPITNNITLYAQWIDKALGPVITFDADGGTVEPGSKQVETGGQAGFLPYPEKENCYFQGWFLQKNGLGTEFTSSTVVYTDITVYVKWGNFTPGTNNVAFNSNGGTYIQPTTNVTVNTAIRAPASPTRYGYVFEGWYRDRNLTTRWFFPVNSTTAYGDKVNGNIVLSAKWLPVGGPEESGMYSSNGTSLQLHVGRTTGINTEQINRIYNSDGKVVRLVGANVPSLEWGGGESVVWSAYELFTNWNANVVRLCVIPKGWFGTDSSTSGHGNAANYRATVDRVVALANNFGKYVILDNHEYICPTQNTLNFWKDAAVHYKNNPAVLFGLLNEPHTVSWTIWQNGGTSGGTAYIGHQLLVDEIRALGANNIIVAGGLEWGYTLDGIAANNFARILVDKPEGRGIMYDSHAYPWKDSKGFPRNATVVLCMADKAPILIGEFGIEEENQNGGGDSGRTHTVLQKPWYMEDILNWMELHGFSFAAWNFHNSSAPRMVLGGAEWSARQNVIPNQYFGQQVYARLKSYPNSNSHLVPLPARPSSGN